MSFISNKVTKDTAVSLARDISHTAAHTTTQRLEASGPMAKWLQANTLVAHLISYTEEPC